jgi:hypothetical protein
MRELFAEHTPLGAAEIQRIWDTGFIVPDANVLLNLYRFTETARDELFGLFENPQVLGRIWLPYWAALEFHRNRATVIAEQAVPYQRITAMIDKHIRNLVEEIKEVQLHRFHPFISKEDLTSATTTLRDALLTDLKTRASGYPNFLTDDPILQRVQNLFAGKHGIEPTDAEREEIIRVGEDRFKKKIPPGFLDEGKEGIDRYGDYIIWREVIERANTVKLPAIIVTDDAKEDWWYRTKGKTVGARPEMRREFRGATGHDFLLYTSTEFARHAREYVGHQAGTDGLIREMEVLRLMGQIRRERVEGRVRSTSTDDRSATSDLENEETPSADEMIEWFHAHYEDPANGVPYDGREGGYQYFNGGPFDPLEVLSEEYPDAPFEVVEKAAEEIYGDGFEWVRKGDY